MIHPFRQAIGRYMELIIQNVRFYSRLPMPVLPWEVDPHALPDFRTLPIGLPIASLIIAFIPALILIGSFESGLSPHICAALCIASLVFMTGGFHEDGLADCADGFGGGLEREKRLIIMQDSRVGAFGAAALGIVILLRVITLADVGLTLTPLQTGGMVIIVAMLSRVLGLVPLTFLPPAKPDGFSAKVGQPTRSTLIVAVMTALIIAALLIWVFELPPLNLLRATALALLMTFIVSALSWHKIQGQTGDVAGATQQVTEVALYIGFLIAIPH
jgi:adenosylcobinamide-GDP ribazoletransferase